MTFDHSRLFSLLFAIIPFAVLAIIHFKRKFHVICSLSDISDSYTALTKTKHKAPKQFFNSSPEKKQLLSHQKYLKLRYIFSVFFFLLFYALIVVALCGPHWGKRVVQELQRGADVIIAFDISRSMNVSDAPPIETQSVLDTHTKAPNVASNNSSTRLQRSLWIAKNFIDSFNGLQSVNIRLGIAIGKGEAVLAVPLTDDKEAVWALLETLGALSMTSRGTNLEKLLDCASTAFKDEFPSARHVILFSDGETLAGSLNSALERLKSKNITVIAVGSGSVYGAPLPDAVDGLRDGTRNAVKRTKPIISYLKEDMLISALERNGGTYIDGNKSGAPILLSSLIKPDSLNTTLVVREISGGRRDIFILLSLFCFTVSVLFTVKLKTY
ncbi:MAG: hypothetical protein Ta2B_28900 [Termitinemataceae bacterium]|nr:MAG: hypothetical protein Ta2B_28900 [Termitinemataceae bacterium]